MCFFIYISCLPFPHLCKSGSEFYRLVYLILVLYNAESEIGLYAFRYCLEKAFPDYESLIEDTTYITSY